MTEREHASRRWVQRPEGSTWGEFGDDDVLGRINLLTPEKVREGMSEVVDCRTFSLSLPLTLPGGTHLNPNRLPPIHRPNLRSGLPNANCELRRLHTGATDVLNDDLVVLHAQYSTQWDALVHAGALFDADGDGILEPVYYNGYRAHDDVVGPTDAADCGLSGELKTTADFGSLGIHSMSQHPIQGRAVLVDLHKHFGLERRPIGYPELMRVIELDDLEIRTGDILAFHTGFSHELKRMDGDPDPAVLDSCGVALNGRDTNLLDWISESQVSAIVADNTAVELHPSLPATSPAPVLPLHEHCLFKLGVPLGELWYLTELAEHLRTTQRSAFFLTAPPLNLPGAAGSPVNPIATT